MNAAAPSDIPSWSFPRSWDDLKKVSKEVFEPRVRGDEVTLTGRPANIRTDMLAVTQFAGSGILYKNAGKRAREANDRENPLAEAARVKLADPLVIVPGWSTEPEKFDILIEHLLSSQQNGERAVYLKDGKPFTNKLCTKPTQIQPSDKVFVTIFESTLDAPDKSAPQLEKAVKAVKAGGNEFVDVLGYSMGGLATRKMLDGGTVQVDQVAQLGTANQGTRFASLAGYIIRRDINWAMSLGGISAPHLPAMDWLQTLDPSKPSTNPQLADLNTNLSRQLANCNEFVSIGASEVSTLASSLGRTSGGDGLVPWASLSLEGVEIRLLPGQGNKHHGNLPHDKDVFAELTDYFHWQVVEDRRPLPAGG